MNDLTTALRELEAEAPDTETVRAAVYQGIETRTRRKRLATITGTALTVTALAATAMVMVGGPGDQGQEVASPPRPAQLVPVKVPELFFPVHMEEHGEADFLKNEAGRHLIYGGGKPGSVNLSVVPSRPAKPQQNGKVTEKRTTVSGHPVTLRSYGQPLTASVDVFWRLSPDEWIMVSSATRKTTMRAANSVREELWSVEPYAKIGLAPRGYQVAFYAFGTGLWKGKGLGLSLCPKQSQAETACYEVERTGLPIEDGKEPDASGVCRPARALMEKYGPPRKVNGSTIRLSSDGCSAVKVFGPRRVMELRKPKSVPQLHPDDLARMAASITVRGS